MMTRFHRLLADRREATGDAGFGLILVVAMSLVILGLLVVGSAVSINSMRSSRSHGSFEQAMAVAESGIDQTLARLQVDQTYAPCASPYCSLPVSGFATEAAERTWARSALLAYSGVSGAVQSTSQGQYVAIRPTGGQKVYALSWVPSKASPGARVRLLKAEYLFSPYKPANALSAQGNVSFTGGSVTIEPAAGSAPGQQTPVHTNGSVTGSANSVNIAGAVTSSGTYTLANGANVGAGSGGSAPLESVPVVDPRSVYTNAGSASYAANWYDLCPDGKVYAKAATTPCTGSQLADTTLTGASPGFRGWTYTISGSQVTWNMSLADSPYGGVYYVYQGDANVDGGTTGQTPAWNATVLAEAKPNGNPGNASTCNKSGGNITWHNTDVNAYYPGLVLEAGSDLNVTGSSNHMQLGMFAATDQVYLASSSATFMTGAVIADDSCADAANPSSLQGITLDFDSTFESPIQSIIRTTQWIEYAG